MRYIITRDIRLADLTVPNRLRPVDDGWVAALAESMSADGQNQPIEVLGTAGGSKARLIAGAHRAAAAKLLGWNTIRAAVYETESARPDMEMRLREIDENLVRHELNPLDRAVFLAERKKVYEELYPQAKHGGDRGNQHTGGRQELIIGFCQQTAERMRVSASTIKRAIRIANILSPEIRERIKGTPIAQKEGELYQLTQYSPEQQGEIIESCLKGNHQIKSVKAAGDIIDGHAKKMPSQAEAHHEKLYDTWKRCASKKGRRRFLEDLVEMGVIPSYNEAMI